MDAQTGTAPSRATIESQPKNEKKGMVLSMKKTFAILLILSLCVVPVLSLASASPHIEAVDFENGCLSGTVAGPSGRIEAVVTLFCVGNWYFTISTPVETDGSFALYVGTLPVECITVAIRDAMTGAVFDAAMLIL